MMIEAYCAYSSPVDVFLVRVHLPMEDLFLGRYIVARLHFRLVLVGCFPIKNLYVLHMMHILVPEGPLLHARTAIKRK